MHKPLIARTGADHLLYRFQADWRLFAKSQDQSGLDAICEEIARHPEWGLVIGQDGPESAQK